MVWLEVTATLNQVPADWSFPVSAFHDLGCPNTRIIDDPPQIIGCFPDLPGAEETINCLLLSLVPIGVESVSTRPIPDQDWIETFKEHFKRKSIGDRLIIIPTWDHDPVPEGRAALYLDPGQAFGTGDHPTTQMCLELLERCHPEGKLIADIGCGSGILSIAARNLGARAAIGIDIEESSVDVARENGERNGVDVDFIVGNHPRDLLDRRPFDLVLSNIISATLINFAPFVPSLLQPGGGWLVSGIIPANWPDVLSAAERAGFHVAEKQERDGWIAATLALQTQRAV